MESSYQMEASSDEEITSSEEENSTDKATASEEPKPGQKRPRKIQAKPKDVKKHLNDERVPAAPTKIAQSPTMEQPAPAKTTEQPAPATPATNQQPQQQAANQQPPTATPMTTRMPSIFCYSANIAEISRFCRGKNLKVTFKNRNSKSTIISAGNRAAFDELKDFLKSRKIQFNSFTPREERKNLLLLKGIHSTFSAFEVEDELKIEGLPVIKVTRFKARSQGKAYNNFVVELSRNCNITEVYTKTLIMNQRVHWERLQSKDIVQCRNCQRFGHVATNCGRQYVCVKCKENHEPGQCKRTVNTGLDVWCANCEKEGHPASFKGCPALIKKRTEKNKLQSDKKAHQKFIAQSACTGTQPFISFASMLKKGQTPPSNISQEQLPAKIPAKAAASKVPTKSIPARPAPRSLPAPSMNLSNEVQRIFGSDLLSVMQKAKNAVPSNYTQLSEGEKSVALATFIFQICN